MVSLIKRRELRLNTNTSTYKGLWQELKPPAPIPSRRCHHSASIVNNKLVIYGGQDITVGVFNDLWLLNIDNINPQNEHWYNIIATGDYPGPLCRHSAVVYNEEIYIYGGTDGDYENSNLYRLNLETLVWSKYQGPSPGVDSHSAIVHNDLMIIFGGYQGGSVVNNLYIQSLSNFIWVKKELILQPSPRANHRAVIHNGSMWIYGGRSSESYYLEELWKLNLNDWEWTLIEYTGNSPGVVSAHSACVCGGVMLVFGGVRDMLKETNEMFTYDFTSNSWALIQSEIDIEDPISDKDKTDYLNVPENRKNTFVSKKSLIAVDHPWHSFSGSDMKKPKHRRNRSHRNAEEYVKKVYHGPPAANKGRVRGKIPHSRDGHTANVYEDTMVIFGGDRHQMAFNDVYFYTITEKILKGD